MPKDGPNPEEVDFDHDRVWVADKEKWAAAGKVFYDMISNPNFPENHPGAPPLSGDIEVLEKYINSQSGDEDPVIKFPKRIKTYRIDRSDWSEFVLRLPPWQLSRAGYSRVCDQNGNSKPGVDYEPPEFYEKKINKEPPEMENCEFYLCRVCDYSISMCK